MNPATMTNRQLMDEYERGGRRAANVLPEMAKRAGTIKAMFLEVYATNPVFRESVIRDTISVFRHYKLNGGQDDRY